MCDVPAFIDEEGHNGLWDQVRYVLFNDGKITLDQVLYDDCLHYYARVVLFIGGTSSHFAWDGWKNYWRQIRLVIMALLNSESLENLEFFSLLLHLSQFFSAFLPFATLVREHIVVSHLTFVKGQFFSLLGSR